MEPEWCSCIGLYFVQHSAHIMKMLRVGETCFRIFFQRYLHCQVANNRDFLEKSVNLPINWKKKRIPGLAGVAMFVAFISSPVNVDKFTCLSIRSLFQREINVCDWDHITSNMDQTLALQEIKIAGKMVSATTVTSKSKTIDVRIISTYFLIMTITF